MFSVLSSCLADRFYIFYFEVAAVLSFNKKWSTQYRYLYVLHHFVSGFVLIIEEEMVGGEVRKISFFGGDSCLWLDDGTIRAQAALRTQWGCACVTYLSFSLIFDFVGNNFTYTCSCVVHFNPAALYLYTDTFSYSKALGIKMS